jgi:hypothetical protein
MVWYDFAVIKLPHLFESLGKMGLVRRFDATLRLPLRLWVNTGTVNITVADPTTTDLNYYIDPDQNSFSNTCPLLINHLPSRLTTCTLALTSSLYISKPPSTSYSGGVNLVNSGVTHPLAPSQGFGDSQWKSPFDTCPTTTSPCSMILEFQQVLFHKDIGSGVVGTT